MTTDATTERSDAVAGAPRVRRRRVLLAIAATAVVCVLAVRWLAQPGQAIPLVLDRLGNTLGLEITATGGTYGWRGAPRLTLEGVIAREPGEPPLLRVDRLHFVVPWSTLRSRGCTLVIERIELDAPTLDVAALQRWLEARPDGDSTVPTLTDGLRVREGRVLAEGWVVEEIDIALPALHARRAVDARIGGRYVSDAVAATFALDAGLARPALPAALSLRGRVEVEGDDWQLPSTVALTGTLRHEADALSLDRARLGAAARYRADATELAFRLGLVGPLHLRDGTLSQRIDGAIVRPQDDDAASPVPSIEAHGALAFGERMVLDVRGMLVAWPAAWPALPPPIGASRAPLPFALRYAGAYDFDDAAALRLERDATRFEGRFRLPDVRAWADAAGGSPLPPLEGTLRTPRLQVAGATLDGVEIEIRDEATR